MFLPVGSQFGIDAFNETMALATDSNARDLNKKSRATAEDVDRHHAPGWSPLSFGALAVLVQLALIYLSMALLRTGSWKSGAALGNALHVVRVASPLGFGMRGSGILPALTNLVRYSEFAIPALLFVPILRGPTRLAAAVLMLVHGLVFGLLFNFGLFGWVLAASSVAVISTETWDRVFTKRSDKNVLTVIYDADCGICFWLSRLLRRLDTRAQLTLQGNDSLFPKRPAPAAEPIADAAKSEDAKSDDAETDEPVAAKTTKEEDEAPKGVLWVRNPKTGEITEEDLPKGIDAALVEQSIVVVGPGGEVFTEARAVSAILRAIPGTLVGSLIAIAVAYGPLRLAITLFGQGIFSDVIGVLLVALGATLGIGGLLVIATRFGAVGLSNGLYRLVARNWTRISIACGLAACGTESHLHSHWRDWNAEPVAPSTVLRHRVTGGVRELLVVVLFASALIQQSHENPLPLKLKDIPQLTDIAWYTRMIGHWDVLAPEPPTDNSKMVVDAVTKDNVQVDTFTGSVAHAAFDEPFRLGQLWSDYLYRIQDPKYQGYSQAFRTYITKEGPRWPAPDPLDKNAQGRAIVGLDLYWVTLPAGASESDPAAVEQKRLYRIGRGGATLAGQPPTPLALPQPIRPQGPGPLVPGPPRE